MAEIANRRRRQASDSEYLDDSHTDTVNVSVAPTDNEKSYNRQQSQDYDDEKEEGEITSDSEYTDDSDEGSVADGERNPADGESPHEDALDDDEDVKNPAFIPRKGAFYEHDSRSGADDVITQSPGKDARDEENDTPKSKKLWAMEKKEKWAHDCFDEAAQAPKSRDQLIALYGYDIRSKDTPPDTPPRAYSAGRAQRGRRGHGKPSFGDFANFESRSFRGQRGGRRPYRGNRGRGGGRQQTEYDNSRHSRSGEINQSERSQENSQSQRRSQDARNLDKPMNVEPRGAKTVERKSQDARLDPATPTEGFRPPSKAAEQRPQQPTNQNAPPVASAAKPESSGGVTQTKRYSSQRQTDRQTSAAGKPSPYPSEPRPLLGQQTPSAQPVAPQQQQKPFAGGVGSVPPMQPPYSQLPTVVPPQMFINQNSSAAVRLIPPSGFLPQSNQQMVAGASRPPVIAGVPQSIAPQIMSAMQQPAHPVMASGVAAPMASYVPSPVIATPQMVSQQMAATPPLPTQELGAMYAPRAPLMTQPVPPVAAGAASVSEPGVPIGGAVYYQPSPQRPQMEGTTYYVPPTSTSENSGTTFYPQQQPPPHHFSPTPTAENQGPVYYDTKSQVAKSSPQSRPRVKNVIPIVAPEGELEEERTTDASSTSQPIETQNKLAQPITTTHATVQPIADPQTQIELTRQPEAKPMRAIVKTNEPIRTPETVDTPTVDPGTSTIATSQLLSRIRDEAAAADTGCHSIQSNEEGEVKDSEAVNLSEPYEQENSPSDHPQVDTPSKTLQVDSPGDTLQVNTTEDTLQVDSPSKTLQVDSPSDTLQVNTTEDTLQVDGPSDNPQVDSPGGIPQVDSPSGTPQVDSPSGTPQVDSPSGIPQVDSPSDTPQVDSPSGTPQVDTPGDMQSTGGAGDVQSTEDPKISPAVADVPLNTECPADVELVSKPKTPEADLPGPGGDLKVDNKISQSVSEEKTITAPN